MRNLLILLLFLSGSWVYGSDIGGTWSGGFNVSDLRGGLQLEVSTTSGKWQMKATLQPFGRTSEVPVENLRVTGKSVSFDVEVEKRHCRFHGSLSKQQLRGTVEIRGEPAAHAGAWSASRLLAKTKAGMLLLPDGPYPIGRMSFHWIDNDRPETETPDPNDKRELMVHIWYPAEKTARCTLVPYLPDLAQTQSALPKEVASTVPHVQTHACAGATINSAKKRYPVIIFSPGDEFKTLGYSALQEDLASYGYVVIAVEHPYNALVTVFPDGRVVRPLPAAEEESSSGTPPTPEEAHTKQLNDTLAQLDYWARDLAFVASQVRRLDTSDWPFRARLDGEKIGAFGHSRGGLSAFHLCQIDSVIKACANLDGRYRARVYPASSPQESPRQPIMWIHSPLREFTDEELPQAGLTREQFTAEVALGVSLLSKVEGGSYDLTVDQIGLDHQDFTDFRILEAGLSEETLAARERTLEITRVYLKAFFDSALLGQQAKLLDQLSPAQFPDVRLKPYAPSARNSVAGGPGF
jgi:predicted dienelactone hydrolase